MKKVKKGLIMTIEEGCAIVLTAEGDFIKTNVKLGEYFIGDEINIPVEASNPLLELLSKMRLSLQNPALQVALSLCLVVVGGIGSWAYPVGHVYMDVNPSLGMTYNLYHRVIDMESFNEDGTKVIEKVSYYGKTIDENLENTLKAMNTAGYIKNEEQGVSGVLIGYTDSKLATSVVEQVIETSEKMDKTIQVASIKVDNIAEKIAAEEKGKNDAVSPIQLTLAAKNLKLEATGKVESETQEAQLKAEVKDRAKTLKKKATLQIIEENQGVVKVVPNPKVEEVKKRNEIKKEIIRKINERELKDKKDSKTEKAKEERTKEDKAKEEKTDKVKEDKSKKESPSTDRAKPVHSNDEKYDTHGESLGQNNEDADDKTEQTKEKSLRQQQIIKEIERLKTAIETIQASDLKENQKEARIKKLLKQIERLKENLESLSDD